MPEKCVRRRLARLAAIQVMYQIDITNSDLDKVVTNFESDYIEEEEQYKDIDIAFFKSLVGRFEEGFDIDGAIADSLDGKRNIEHTSKIAISIIKVGILEIVFEATAIPVIINEYVEIAKSFVDESGVRFINAVLDKSAKKFRSPNKK
jgi:N utilization substance protein B